LGVSSEDHLPISNASQRVQPAIYFHLHIRTPLAFSPEEVIALQTLAASVNSNPVVVRWLLRALRRA
jgi:hypothetical protein